MLQSASLLSPTRLTSSKWTVVSHFMLIQLSTAFCTTDITKVSMTHTMTTLPSVSKVLWAFLIASLAVTPVAPMSRTTLRPNARKSVSLSMATFLLVTKKNVARLWLVPFSVSIMNLLTRASEKTVARGGGGWGGGGVFHC